MSTMPGDEIYFQHPEHGVLRGRVLCAGVHGCTVQHQHGRRRVRWGEVHGHRKRAEQAFIIADQGEDGFLAEDRRGRRMFVRHGEDSPMVKSIPLLFLRSSR